MLGSICDVPLLYFLAEIRSYRTGINVHLLSLLIFLIFVVNYNGCFV